MDITSILIVCRGNICRSPMAEGYFARELSKLNSPIVVSSAGLTALSGYPAEQSAKNVMLQQGIDISTHHARQLTEQIVRKNDLILVMSKSQLQMLTQQFISAKGKTFLLGQWSQFEIEDPYTQPEDAFLKTFQKIETAWQEWKTRILACHDVCA